jgi:exonuclease SbcC
MRPLKLTLRGFAGIAAGIGKEEITIDLQGVTGGLVAVVGGNGMGKTTILDNLHPYRLMPYKLRDSASNWSPSAFNFYDECIGKDAMKELIFEMDGKVYKSLVMIDVDRRKQEAYLYVDESGSQWNSPHFSAWKDLNDGKTKTYDIAVEAVVGSPSLFFTGPFRAQDAPKLSSYTRSEMMVVFSELLNVDSIKVQGEKAKKVADALQSQADMVKHEIGTIQHEIELLDDLNRNKATLTEEVGIRKKILAEAKVKLETLVEQITLTKQQIEGQAATAANLAEAETEAQSIREQSALALQKINTEIARLNNEQADLRKILDKVINDQAFDTESAKALHKRETDNLAVDVAETTTAIARCERIMGGAEQIRAKVPEEEKLKNKLTAQREAVASARTGLEMCAKLVTQGQTLHLEWMKLNEQRNLSMRQSASLDQLDCRGDQSNWVNEHCPLLTDAIKAKEQVVELTTQMADCEAKKTAPELVAAEQTATQLRDQIAQTEFLIPEIECELEAARKFTVLLPELERAEQDKEVLLTKRAELEKRQTEADNELAARLDRVAQQADQTRAETNSKIETVVNVQARLEVDAKAETEQWEQRLTTVIQKVDRLKSLVAEDLNAKLVNLNTEKASLLTQIEMTEGALTEKSSLLAKVVDQIEKIGQQKVKQDNLIEQVNAIGSEISDLRLLQKACSNDGIIALEIDDAGPSIAAIANDLLGSCYGNRFSVRIETQTAKSDGSMKEDFDITVFDSERGTEKSITKMSGGEVTWLEDAITRAICLYHLKGANKVYASLFADEKDGALDASRKSEFFAIKRRAMELGGHDFEFFITQTPELVDLADAKIIVAPGSVTVK